MPKINHRRLDRQPKRRNPVAKSLSDGEFKPKRIENKKKDKVKRKKDLKNVMINYNHGVDIPDEFN
jgi:hypothetical protein